MVPFDGKISRGPRALVALASAVVVTACGGGGQGGPPYSSQPGQVFNTYVVTSP